MMSVGRSGGTTRASLHRSRCPRRSLDTFSRAFARLPKCLQTRSSAAVCWFLLTLLVGVPSPGAPRSAGWPLQRTANISGDIMLGALFPIHEANSSYECGRIQIEVCIVKRNIRNLLKSLNAFIKASLIPVNNIGRGSTTAGSSSVYGAKDQRRSNHLTRSPIGRDRLGFMR